MSFIGNLLWCVLFGFWSALFWSAFGVLWCITVIGIPFGLQCFKMAKLTFFPFGKDVVYSSGSVSVLANVLWILFSGAALAIYSAVAGLVFCVTVIGIPFGLQCFKFAKLALFPFGTEIR